MKKRLQGLIAGLLIGTILTGGAVFAKSGTEMIEALYSNIKIYVDGIKIEPKDATGKTVEPFIYNGTTYLPVRAVGEAIGKTVTWDGATQSVFLGGKPGEVQYLLDVCPPYETGSFRDESFYMAGKKYSDGFYSWFYEQDAYFNLDGMYSELNCVVGHVDGYGGYDKTVTFYVDGKKVTEVDIFKGEMPKEVTVPLDYG